MRETINVTVPDPPEFLDPLLNLSRCFYYSVPKFYSYNDPSTRWMVAMINANAEDIVQRKIDVNPESVKGKYFQLVDNPLFYDEHRTMASPMFKRTTVLYLTVVGMSIYLQRPRMTELLLRYREPSGERLGDANDPQYATHVQDAAYGDFHAYPLFIVSLRTECFESTASLLRNGWDPHESVALPLRRRNERRVLRLVDWLDAALAILAQRSLYPLQQLTAHITRDLALYKPSNVKLATVALPGPVPQYGLIDIDDLKPSVKIIGVRSLLQLAEDYDRYQKLREIALQVEQLKRKVSSAGESTEILLSQAGYFDAGCHEQMSEEIKETKKGNDPPAKPDAQRPTEITKLFVTTTAETNYKESLKAIKGTSVSECWRILQFALKRDQKCKSLQQCLDAVGVLLKSDFLMCRDSGASSGSKGNEESQNKQKAEEAENVVFLLTQLVEREQQKIDAVVTEIRSGIKRFKHVETHKLLENKKTSCESNILKMSALVARLLMQSKRLVQFMSLKEPLGPGEKVKKFVTSFRLSQKNFITLRSHVVSAVTRSKDTWKYLDYASLLELRKLGISVSSAGGQLTDSNNNQNLAANTNCGSSSSAASCSGSSLTYRRLWRRSRESDAASAIAASFGSGCNLSSSLELLPDAEDDEPTATIEESDSYAECLQSADRLLGNLCREMDDILKPLERRRPAVSSAAEA